MTKSLIFSALLAGLLGLSAPAFASAKGAPRTHVVYSGQRLGSIAKRYNVSIEALCYANDISERDPIRPGQRLVIPERSDKDGSLARATRVGTERPATSGKGTMRASLERPGSSAASSRRRAGPAWSQYARQPRRKNYVEVHTHNAKWRGLVIDSKGKIRPSAKQAIANLLGATGDHPGVPDRLIRLMVEVSDTFGGRPLHVVSGYRTTSYFRDSRHKTSQAIDFAVVGVPNSAVRDYLLTQRNVGVGYYPNSSFLHLDVRGRSTYWVDYAGPGEAPRKTPGRAPSAPTLVDFDDRAEHAAENNAPADDSTLQPAPAADTPTTSAPATTETSPAAAAAAAAIGAASGTTRDAAESSAPAPGSSDATSPNRPAPRATGSQRP
jgi:uncharacterized protein YcbK (DUF882 family)